MPTVQLRVAAVGVVVATDVGQVKVNAVAVFTVRLTLRVALAPEPGVAVRLPAYVAAAVPVVTVTVPQFDELAAHVVGPPLALVPAGAE